MYFLYTVIILFNTRCKSAFLTYFIFLCVFCLLCFELDVIYIEFITLLLKMLCVIVSAWVLIPTSKPKPSFSVTPDTNKLKKLIKFPQADK